MKSKCQDKRSDITVQILYQPVIYIQAFYLYKQHFNGGVINLNNFKLKTKYLKPKL